MKNHLLVSCLFTSFILKVVAQPSTALPFELTKQVWKSFWITANTPPQYPAPNLREYGVYHFRKTFDLIAKPSSCIAHVSADNRYKLYVNGKYVGNGPARSDLAHWQFETYDLGPYLQAGKNVVAALVWNQGEHKPIAQMSVMTGFMLQANDTAMAFLNTNKSWRVVQSAAYSPTSTDNMSRLRSFVVVGCGDRLAAAQYLWDWEKPNFDDSAWQSPRQLEHPIPVGVGSGANWHIEPRLIPHMEDKAETFAKVSRLEPQMNFDPTILRGGNEAVPHLVPAKTQVKILIDNEKLAVGYPILSVSGGEGATIRLEYAEALVDKKGQKGNRNAIEGKILRGYYDEFLPDGKDNRQFTTLWLRTFRYIELTIQTDDKPLTINNFHYRSATYPFEQKASFSANDKSLSDIWQVGWRTARLCAGETYFDCPYYEQLQYVGDTRIQALISLYVSGDGRLVRKAITDIHNSLSPEGLTQARYPNDVKQVIPPFSLFWVNMVYDYWLHHSDEAFVQQFLPAVQQVLAWYERHLDPSVNMLGGMPWWNFVDWTDQWRWHESYSIGGIPDGANEGGSSILTCQYAYTLRQAAQVYAHFGDKSEAKRLSNMAQKIGTATFQRCFDSGRGLLADTPKKAEWSQHASIMGILAGAIPASQKQAVMQRLLTDTSLIQASFYYRFYLIEALKEVGWADKFHDQLDLWRQMLSLGLTTFAEKQEPTRSDCHAWSASPNYYFLSLVCGIMPSKVGFSEVIIEPALGNLTEVTGRMPHPLGEIQVHFKKDNQKGFVGTILLPKGLNGVFVWQKKRVILRGGIEMKIKN